MYFHPDLQKVHFFGWSRWGQADPRGGFIGGSEPLRDGQCQGFSGWALGFVLVELAIILSALSPKLERAGEGREVLGERKAAICLRLSGSGFCKDD